MPVVASSATKWPRRLAEKPYSTPLANTGDAVYSVTSVFFQIGAGCQAPPDRDNMYACVPWRVPATINELPVQIGVTMFSCHSSGNGIDQSAVPVPASRPMIEPFVIVMI